MTVPLPMEYVEAGEHAGTVVVRLEQPGRPVVVLDEDLIRRLDATLDALRAETAGLALASASERAFVAGADLKAIADLDDRALLRYLEYGARVFGRLSQLPFPTVAAINGAALGGGLELAMHCDGLVAAPSPQAKPYPVGLPECGLCICPGWGGTNLLPARIDPARAIRLIAEGKPMMYDEAVAAGMFDRVAETPEALLDTALSWVGQRRRQRHPDRDGSPSRWVGRNEAAASVLAGLDSIRHDLPRTASASAVVDAVEAGLTRGWKAALAAEQSRLVRLRSTPEAKTAIEAFFARGKKK